MTMMYFLLLVDVTGNGPVQSEEIYPLICKKSVNTMFAWEPISPGMESGVVIALGVINFLVDEIFLCS